MLLWGNFAGSFEVWLSVAFLQYEFTHLGAEFPVLVRHALLGVHLTPQKQTYNQLTGVLHFSLTLYPKESGALEQGGEEKVRGILLVERLLVEQVKPGNTQSFWEEHKFLSLGCYSLGPF